MRAANMQALTNDLQRRYPGVTIYGIGDDAHKLVYSDHNEDDTPGSKAAQSDSDNVPEHRAIDVMLGGMFTKDEAEALVNKMVNDTASKVRLYYVIWNGHIWSRSDNWTRKVYNGQDKHTSHVHYSGWAPDDENTASWPVVFASAGSGPSSPFLHRPWPSYMPMNHYFGLITGPTESHGGYYPRERGDVQAIQRRLIVLGYVPGVTNPSSGWADGKFEQPTKDAVTHWQKQCYGTTTSRYGEVWNDDWHHLFTY